MNPTNRSIKKLEEEGWIPQVVEQWIPYAKKRRDLYGFIDILAIKDADVLAIQATTRSHVSDRVKKIENSKYVDAVRKCAWSIEVWGWYQTKDGDWKVRIVDCS